MTHRLATAFSASLAATLLTASAAAFAAGPKVVNGPGENPGCFKPWNTSTKFLQWPAKKGPYRVALANGFVGNTWRVYVNARAAARPGPSTR